MLATVVVLMREEMQQALYSDVSIQQQTRGPRVLGGAMKTSERRFSGD